MCLQDVGGSLLRLSYQCHEVAYDTHALFLGSASRMNDDGLHQVDEVEPEG